MRDNIQEIKLIDNQNLKAVSSDSNDFLWKWLYLMWVVYLFRPEWLFSYYIPFLTRLRMLPTFLTYGGLILWICSDQKKDLYKWFGVFLLIAFFSSLFAENTGRARNVLRSLFELYVLAIITLSVVNNKLRIDKLIDLYLWYFLYLGIWGLIGFLTTGRGLVSWDWVLNEEDAFGPVMCMGVGYSLYYFYSRRTGTIKKFALLTTCICTLGVVLSFARGAFLVLIALAAFFVLMSENRLKTIMVIFIMAIVVFMSTSIFFPNNAFWKEMNTISEGTNKGTGEDRKELWQFAWEEFKDNPIIGVGPWNFGVVSSRYIDKVKNTHYRAETMYGRALHNGFFEILCELGLLGSITFLILLLEFFRMNKAIKIISKENSDKERKYKIYQISLGIKITMVVFLLNAFFYDIIFYSWIWLIFILNRAFYNNLNKYISDHV
jgi:O-antigen ligase